MNFKSAQRNRHSPRVPGDMLREVCFRLLIRDAKAAAGVDIFDGVPFGAEGANQLCNPGHCLPKGQFICDLRADMNTDSRDCEILRLRSFGVEMERAVDWHPEFVLVQA